MRIQGWEARLADVVREARGTAYRLGDHDCFRFACEVVHALTGVDHWTSWAGKYSTEAEALVLIRNHGGSFTGTFSKIFGSAPIPITFAQRGDIAEIQDETGQKHLGVVIGADVAVLMDSGLHFLSRRACTHAWRIG